MRQTETLSAQNDDGKTPVAPMDTRDWEQIKKQHVKTAGEKKFDWEVYGRIGYYANVLISLGAVAPSA